MSLLKRMQKNSKVAHSAILSESTLFDYDRIVHDVPIINIAFAGSVSNGGIVPGVTIFAGKSKHGKSLMALSCVRQIMKASLNKGKECPCLFYDSEFGTPKSYINSFGIDSTQILHCPITDIEQLKFDIVSQLQEVGDGENLVIFIDSIGNAASKKEVDDTLDSKSTADMTRAKQLKSLFRMITPYMRIKKIHLVVVAHTYDTMEMFSKAVVGGGTGAYYAADNIFILGRQQEKEAKDVVGFNIMMNVEKSRYCREKSVFPIELRYDSGINKWSGMLDIAIELGFVVKPSNGWYSRVIDGVAEDQKFRKSATNDSAFWNPIMSNPAFNTAIEKRYMLSVGNMISDDNDAALAAEDEIDD